jgi:hypothetical protein
MFRYNLRTLLIVLAIAPPLLAGVVLVRREYVRWFQESDIGAVAESRFNVVFAKRGWSGRAAPFFYDGRVRIESADIGDNELRELYPILRAINWLRHIELHGTGVTPDGIADFRRQFPGCHVSQNKE